MCRNGVQAKNGVGVDTLFALFVDGVDLGGVSN